MECTGTCIAHLRHGGQTVSLAEGQSVWGWTLKLATADPIYPLGESAHPVGVTATTGQAVLETNFDEWGEFLFLSTTTSKPTSTATSTATRLATSMAGAPVSVRKPVGRLDRIKEPMYDVKVGVWCEGNCVV